MTRTSHSRTKLGSDAHKQQSPQNVTAVDDDDDSEYITDVSASNSPQKQQQHYQQTVLQPSASKKKVLFSAATKKGRGAKKSGRSSRLSAISSRLNTSNYLNNSSYLNTSSFHMKLSNRKITDFFQVNFFLFKNTNECMKDQKDKIIYSLNRYFLKSYENKCQKH